MKNFKIKTEKKPERNGFSGCFNSLFNPHILTETQSMQRKLSLHVLPFLL